MSRLFLRIFLWFWIGSTTLLLVLAISLLVAQPEAVATWRALGETAVEQAGAHVADVFEQRGPAAAEAVVQSAAREGRLRLWLYAPDGRLIAGSAPPAGAAEAVAGALRSEPDAERIVSRSASVLARRTTSDSGVDYVVAWEGPRSPRWFARMSPLRLAMRAAALVLTSAVVCALLTWQITRPVGLLRAAARRLAEGDLAARVSANRSLRRREALSDLAREFDGMAARIERLVQSQQRLLADISHELRSPLARLSLALDLARQRLGADVPEHARMEQEIERLNALIGQLLTLARLRTASGPPTFERLTLGDVVNDVAQDARFEAETGGKSVIVAGDLGTEILGNRSLLRSALDNVVRNALRYTPEGSSVVITTHPKDDSGRVAIVVRDHGPGVAPEMIERVFDPFFRADAARDRDRGGTGLGLAIARQAMVAHGGSATAANHPDRGFAVRLEWPATIPDKS
jgi:two-component system sensor histidine kinase CpxA